VICFFCKQAGLALPERPESPEVATWHCYCKGGNHCDCQHKTVSMLRKGDK
jgi:hypothetical protein